MKHGTHPSGKKHKNRPMVLNHPIPFIFPGFGDL